ncbi:peptidylprolyl isomerase [Gynuella sp.]|uniref:peptidylprolyl isomerase n=1 Tax=Gynuella sp. TaxID=2969146 RepID=UPI003D11BF80
MFKKYLLIFGLLLSSGSFAANPQAVIETSLGTMTLELYADKAPVTVANFVQYANDHYYDGLIFHRVISGFMIQGGGFEPGMKQRQTNAPIKNEADNGLSNLRGTIAMARTNDPNSATSQFFINHKDNNFLDYANPAKPGYAVFGKVIDGMDTVDRIARVQTTRVGAYSDVPAETVKIISITIEDSKTE